MANNLRKMLKSQSAAPKDGIQIGVFALRAVSVEDLKPGLVLARSLVNDDMVVVISEDTVLTKAHITRLNFLNIPVVYVKDEYELSNNYQTASAVFNRGNAFIKEYSTVVDTAKAILKEVGDGKPEKIQAAKDVVTASIAPLSRNSGVIDHLFELNHLASDVYQHSLRVSVLSGVIGKWMHFDRAKCRDIMLAGFLHDIGKTKMPQRILDKNAAKLQGDDYEAYIKHTVDGHHIISGLPDISEGVKLAAMQHHERMDGSGFPFGCKGGDIHLYADIVAIADIYDNITTEREGYVKQNPFDAISYITEHLYTSLDPTVCIPVLTHIKDAFLGSRVTLSNGLAGIIVSFPNDFAARPIISISSEELVNLNDHPEIKIVEYNPK